MGAATAAMPMPTGRISKPIMPWIRRKATSISATSFIFENPGNVTRLMGATSSVDGRLEISYEME